MAEVSGISIMSTLYVTLPLALIVLIWKEPLQAHSQDAQHYLIFLVIGTWASDIGAYSFGRLFGRHKLAPARQPRQDHRGVHRRHRHDPGDRGGDENPLE